MSTRPECRAGPLDHGGEVGAAGDVGRQGEGAAAEGGYLAGGALGARLVELGDYDVGAEAGQLEGGGAADASAGAGDDCDLALEVHG